MSYRLVGTRYPEPRTWGKMLQGCSYAPPSTLPKRCPLPAPRGVGQCPGQTLLAAMGRASPQAVLQQLVGAGRAGTGHQAHGGLVEEDLEGKEGRKGR